jgi:hypothetical protein
MTRADVMSWALAATMIAAAVAWVMRSNRHRAGAFELDCTAPPDRPEAVRASVGPEGVTFRWQLDRDVQIATTYLVEAGSAPRAKDVVVVPVPRGIETVTIPLPQGTSFARVLARNYCGTSLPSDDVRVAVP